MYKADATTDVMWAKKLKLAETAVRIQKQQVVEITRRNEIMLFANGPGSADSEMGRKYFELKQNAALLQLEETLKKNNSESTVNFNVV